MLCWLIPKLTRAVNALLWVTGSHVQAHVNWWRDEIVYRSLSWRGRMLWERGEPIPEKYIIRQTETAWAAMTRIHQGEN